MRCKECGSENTQKYGVRRNKAGYFQKYKCQECGAVFRDDDPLVGPLGQASVNNLQREAENE